MNANPACVRFRFAVASSGCKVSAQTDNLPEISLFGLFGRTIILNKTWTGIQKSGTDQLTAALYSFGRNAIYLPRAQTS
ncbi:MAG TPA: hypothetical protein PLD60_12160 [Leptospiraceae bacterium]|nr:hypothetical protein [Leptospiraceae bacterium]